MKNWHILFLLLGIDAFVLFSQTSQLSISKYEASLLYGDFSFLQSIIKTSLYFFGQNGFALRLPMIVMHISSAIFLYAISDKYIKDEKNRLWLVLIFILLPGVISSAILVDSAGLLIFGLLLFIFTYEKLPLKYSYFLLCSYVFIDGGFLYLFLAMFLFALYTDKKRFYIFNFIAFFSSMFLYGLNTKGSPEGHFLDAIGIYSAIFTPIIFIYLFYVLYRRYLTKEINILWFISSTAVVISLLLSFRQNVKIEHFAPYLIVALPLGVEIFAHSYRVRLKNFRKKYKTVFIVSLIFLLINSFLVFFNKELYLILQNPKKHFAYKMHIAKELATQLKDMDIYCVDTNSNMSKRLQFYGVTKCSRNILTENDKFNNGDKTVTISYKNRPLFKASVTKVNNN